MSTRPKAEAAPPMRLCWLASSYRTVFLGSSSQALRFLSVIFTWMADTRGTAILVHGTLEVESPWVRPWSGTVIVTQTAAGLAFPRVIVHEPVSAGSRTGVFGCRNG